MIKILEYRNVSKDCYTQIRITIRKCIFSSWHNVWHNRFCMFLLWLQSIFIYLKLSDKQRKETRQGYSICLFTFEVPLYSQESIRMHPRIGGPFRSPALMTETWTWAITRCLRDVYFWELVWKAELTASTFLRFFSLSVQWEKSTLYIGWLYLCQVLSIPKAKEYRNEQFTQRLSPLFNSLQIVRPLSTWEMGCRYVRVTVFYEFLLIHVINRKFPSVIFLSYYLKQADDNDSCPDVNIQRSRTLYWNRHQKTDKTGELAGDASAPVACMCCLNMITF